MSLFSGEKVVAPVVVGTPSYKQTTSASATAGSTQSVPATVLGYINANVVNPTTGAITAVKIPYFAV